MGIDAVAVLQPRHPSRIAARIDPEEPGTRLVPLDDGTILYHSLLRFRVVEGEPKALRQLLEETFGDDLPAVHGDPRGVFVFPDICEPQAQSYERLLEELDRVGIWVPLDDSVLARDHAARQLAKRNPSAPSLLTPDLMAKLRELMANGKDPGSEEAQALAASILPSFDDLPPLSIACVLVKRKTPLVPEAEEMNALHELRDGSVAVMSTMMSNDDDFAWRLAEEYRHWAADHDDPRGVPLFGATAFDRVRQADSYDDALAKLGDAVTFVKPKSSAVRDEERKAKLRLILASDGPLH